MNKIYRDKVELLLRVIPVIYSEDCFAMHGGTTINLFVNDLLRYSVDIDLTYLPLDNRDESLRQINEALLRIAEKVKTTLKGVRIIPRLDICKLTLEYRGRQIKIEVNQTKRGIVGGEPLILHLSDKAQDDFEMDVKMRIVPLTLLYGGKIAAALSRQHPRDLFDIKHMSIPISEAKYGFIFCLLGSDRPLFESFAPRLIDQSEAMVNQFEGMSEIPFSYDDFTETRKKLILDINDVLTPEDKNFLIDFERADPDWQNSPYAEFANYPSVKWKLLNLSKLKKSNPSKLEENVEKLKSIFGM